MEFSAALSWAADVMAVRMLWDCSQTSEGCLQAPPPAPLVSRVSIRPLMTEPSGDSDQLEKPAEDILTEEPGARYLLLLSVSAWHM